MKPESINMFVKEGTSDKVYNVSLQEQDGGWVVNYSHGRRGSSLKSDTKTKSPLEYEKAKKIYDSLVLNKQTTKGYKKVGGTEGDFSNINTSEVKDTGVRVQLLNEIEEEDVEKFIQDPQYCAQEKSDGRRRALIRNSQETIGTNRKGLAVAISDALINELRRTTEITLDGEAIDEHVMVFDILNHPTEGDVRNASYRRRYNLLTKWFTEIGPTKNLRLVETAWTTEEKRALYNRMKEENAEGIVFKDVNAKYTAGKPNSGGTQFKFKFYATASCIVKEANDGKRSVSLQVWNGDNLIDVGNVTVYPNQEIPKQGAIVEIKYLYYFKNGSLFQPSLLMERDDIDNGDCVLSQLKLKKEEQE